jgi:predicted transcriptional regulator
MNRNLYEQRPRYLSYLMNDFLLWYLARLRERFDGDLDAALILGEIAHYNVQKNLKKIFSQEQATISCQEQSFSETSPERDLLKSSNTLSISASTGIPRETVRRKIRWLEQHGWVLKDDKGALTVTASPIEDFAEFNFESLERFIATADKLRRVLELSSTEDKDSPSATECS